MCILDSHVYQIGGLCYFIRESHVRSVSRYRFIRNYAAIPVQLEVVVLQYISYSMDFCLQSIQLLLPLSGG